jgi:hypothetical protein
MSYDDDFIAPNGITILYVPRGSKAAYAEAEVWKEFKVIVEIANADVNKDGLVNIGDVTALIDIILDKDATEPYLYDHDCADINGDSLITIADVTALIDIILGR